MFLCCRCFWGCWFSCVCVCVCACACVCVCVVWCGVVWCGVCVCVCVCVLACVCECACEPCHFAFCGFLHYYYYRRTRLLQCFLSALNAPVADSLQMGNPVARLQKNEPACVLFGTPPADVTANAATPDPALTARKKGLTTTISCPRPCTSTSKRSTRQPARCTPPFSARTHAETTLQAGLTVKVSHFTSKVFEMGGGEVEGGRKKLRRCILPRRN